MRMSNRVHFQYGGPIASTASRRRNCDHLAGTRFTNRSGAYACKAHGTSGYCLPLTGRRLGNTLESNSDRCGEVGSATGLPTSVTASDGIPSSNHGYNCARDTRHSPMTADIQGRFQALNVWHQSGRRAPHKPLLALWAIGRCLRGEPRLAPYKLVDKELADLLRRFGPHRKTIHTEYPFWRMRRDGVWEVDRPSLVGRTPIGDAHKGDLKRHQICGGLMEADYSMLQMDPSLALRIAENLVVSHFSASLHDAVLEATVTLPDRVFEVEIFVRDELTVSRRRRRDPRFRAKVLEAYGGRCAVCEFAGHIRGEPLAIEAAHIKWHEFRGPDEVENGLALCSLHHALFDKGAYTLLPENEELTLVVADVVAGAGVEPVLRRYHRERLRSPPLDGFSRPHPGFLAWHRREVFQAPEQLR